MKTDDLKKNLKMFRGTRALKIHSRFVSEDGSKTEQMEQDVFRESARLLEVNFQTVKTSYTHVNNRGKRRHLATTSSLSLVHINSPCSLQRIFQRQPFFRFQSS